MMILMIILIKIRITTEKKHTGYINCSVQMKMELKWDCGHEHYFPGKLGVLRVRRKRLWGWHERKHRSQAHCILSYVGQESSGSGLPLTTSGQRPSRSISVLASLCWLAAMSVELGSGPRVFEWTVCPDHLGKNNAHAPTLDFSSCG